MENIFQSFKYIFLNLHYMINDSLSLWKWHLIIGEEEEVDPLFWDPIASFIQEGESLLAIFFHNNNINFKSHLCRHQTQGDRHVFSSFSFYFLFLYLSSLSSFSAWPLEFSHPLLLFHRPRWQDLWRTKTSFKKSFQEGPLQKVFKKYLFKKRFFRI